MRRLRAGAGTFLLAAAFLAGCAAPPAPQTSKANRPKRGPIGRFVVAGLVLDAGGLPVASLPVRVLVSARPVSLDPRLHAKRLTALAEGETAPDGSYRLEFPVKPAPRRYYLSFYAPGRFDEVRFARPDRIDITRRVKPGGSLPFDFRLSFHDGWAKVQETLKVYPMGSPRARVIRRYGFAEEIRKKKGDAGIEVWWYYTKGKSFSFRGNALVGESTFTPVLK